MDTVKAVAYDDAGRVIWESGEMAVDEGLNEIALERDVIIPAGGTVLIYAIPTQG